MHHAQFLQILGFVSSILILRNNTFYKKKPKYISNKQANTFLNKIKKTFWL